MKEILEFISSCVTSIFGIILNALVRYWNFLQDLINNVANDLIQKLVQVMPETQQTLSSDIMDYVECLNYYFPVRELFVIIAIYLQFRIALFIVRTTVKIASAGQV